MLKHETPVPLFAQGLIERGFLHLLLARGRGKNSWRDVQVLGV